MADDKQQNKKISKMILVKKADGTSERVSFDEWKAMKAKGASAPASSPAPPAASPVQNKEVGDLENQVDREVISEPTLVPEPAPVPVAKSIPAVEPAPTPEPAPVPAPEPVKKSIPVVEPPVSVPEPTPVRPVAPPTPVPLSPRPQEPESEKPVAPVVPEPGESAMPSPAPASSQYKEATRISYDSDGAKQGNNTPKLSRAEDAIGDDHTWDNDDHVSLLDDSLHDDLPMVVDHKAELPATTSPVKDIFVDEAAAKETGKEEVQVMSATKSAENIPVEKIEEPAAKPAPSGLDHLMKTEMPIMTPTGKPMIHDVVTPLPKQKMSMGPIDELREMTIEDFRRFSSVTEEATKKLLSKFEVLRGESYVLYVDAVEAWHQSPLYRQYLDEIKYALKSKQTIYQVIASPEKKSSLTEVEFKELVSLNNMVRP